MAYLICDYKGNDLDISNLPCGLEKIEAVFGFVDEFLELGTVKEDGLFSLENADVFPTYYGTEFWIDCMTPYRVVLTLLGMGYNVKFYEMSEVRKCEEILVQLNPVVF